MSETINVPVEVDPDFWDAIGEEDYERANKLLANALKNCSHRAAKEGCDDSILGTHLHKYTSDGATLEEGSITVENIAWENDLRGGSIDVSFGESEYRGCSDLNHQGAELVNLPFTTDIEEQRIFLELLENKPCFSGE